MRKLNIIFLGLLLIGGTLTSCKNKEFTITVCASELPHAKILNEAVAPILKEKGYELEVTVLDWTIQNTEVASGQYDANYFQHIPYLDVNNFEGENELKPAAKVHYEKLCLYASDKDTNKKLDNGETIEIVNDESNIERALLLLESYDILKINKTCYNDNNEFTNFDTTNPNSCVTFLEGYTNCRLTCIAESNLCVALPDYNFGVIPGNTALTGLGDGLSERIVLSEKANEETISERANIICVKKSNISSPKTIALVEACGDNRVASYILKTFGDSVLYHFENLL
jgi:D-methionine transport system substrate-binding protein